MCANPKSVHYNTSCLRKVACCSLKLVCTIIAKLHAHVQVLNYCQAFDNKKTCTNFKIVMFLSYYLMSQRDIEKCHKWVHTVTVAVPDKYQFWKILLILLLIQMLSFFKKTHQQRKYFLYVKPLPPLVLLKIVKAETKDATTGKVCDKDVPKILLEYIFRTLWL